MASPSKYSGTRPSLTSTKPLTRNLSELFGLLKRSLQVLVTFVFGAASDRNCAERRIDRELAWNLGPPFAPSAACIPSEPRI